MMSIDKFKEASTEVLMGMTSMQDHVQTFSDNELRDWADHFAIEGRKKMSREELATAVTRAWDIQLMHHGNDIVLSGLRMVLHFEQEYRISL